MQDSFYFACLCSTNPRIKKWARVSQESIQLIHSKAENVSPLYINAASVWNTIHDLRNSITEAPRILLRSQKRGSNKELTDAGLSVSSYKLFRKKHSNYHLGAGALHMIRDNIAAVLTPFLSPNTMTMHPVTSTVLVP